MGMRINTNQVAVNAQRNLRMNQATLATNTEKLASGNRINKSADDAAGLAISESLTASIRSFNQSGRNAQDGISFVQVAEGGMAEISNMVIRLRELSVQAASDTVGKDERGFLDREAQQLKSEIQRISLSTQFNGTPLLQGAGENLDFQIGIKNDDFQDRITYSPSKTNVTLDALGLADVSLEEKAGAQGGLASLDSAITIINSNRSELGALQNRLQSTINNNEVAMENFSAARSRIRDTDLSAVSADLARDTVKAQASTSVLAQANQSTAMALKLIG